MARSDSYESIINDSLSKIESWIEHGNTDKEIAEKLGISYATYRKYKSNSVALKSVIATAKDKKSQEVEKSLFKKCLGYKYKEEIAMKVKDETLAEDGKTILTKEKVVVKEVEKYSQPDLGAIKYYLNNREKARWKEDPHKVRNDNENLKLKKKEVESRVISL